jgi:uncharacterized membrane protein
MPDPAKTAFIATFSHHEDADDFVARLREAGFREDQIGVVTRTDAVPPPEGAELTEEGAVAGAATGGLLGALAGSLAAGLIPGIGPVVAGGLLLTVLEGVAAGAVTGGLIGALAGLGVSEDEARRYHKELEEGKTVVVVQPDGRFGEVLAILKECEEDAEAEA